MIEGSHEYSNVNSKEQKHCLHTSISNISHTQSDKENFLCDKILFANNLMHTGTERTTLHDSVQCEQKCSQWLLPTNTKVKRKALNKAFPNIP